MKRFVKLLCVLATAAGVLPCSVYGADLNCRIVCDRYSTMTVSTCGTGVLYDLYGDVSKANNEGLAGFTIDIALSGASMELADGPIAAPMLNFDSPLGVTGSSGFRGRLVDGKLVDVGGAQNTVRKEGQWNVITGVGHSDTILVTGTVTVPNKPGTYTLSISNARATVIKQGEDGTGSFWATEPVNKITTSALTIIVELMTPPATATTNGPLCANESLMLSGGPFGAIDYRWTGPQGFTSGQQNPVVSPAIPGPYRLTVTDIHGCETTAETMVELLTNPCDPWADCNGNDVHDVCDVTRTLAQDCETSGQPDECVVPGDTDVDGALDSSDFPFWITCMTGPCGAPCAMGCCSWIDVDSDGDVDLKEIAAFQRMFGSK